MSVAGLEQSDNTHIVIKFLVSTAKRMRVQTTPSPPELLYRLLKLEDCFDSFRLNRKFFRVRVCALRFERDGET